MFFLEKCKCPTPPQTRKGLRCADGLTHPKAPTSLDALHLRNISENLLTGRPRGFASDWRRMTGVEVKPASCRRDGKSFPEAPADREKMVYAFSFIHFHLCLAYLESSFIHSFFLEKNGSMRKHAVTLQDNINRTTGK